MPLMNRVRNEKASDEEGKPSGLGRLQLNLKPQDLKEYLDQYIVRQDQAKTIIATKVCTHFNRVLFDRSLPAEDGGRSVGQVKNNIIMIGPTGVGKTYMIKLVAKKLGVPMVKADATKFSETGYVGGDVDDLVRQLYFEAGEDKELAEHGIIYLDEIDKIASTTNLLGPDVSRTGVQRALLKPMEETEIDLKTPHDPVSQIQAIERYRRTGKVERKTINTRNILFIMSGAFNELPGIIKKRLHSQGLGFTADISSKEEEYRFMNRVRAEDLIQFGFESEFVGRLPVVAVLEPLDEGDLYAILRNPNNPIVTGKRKDFRSYGIDLRFEDGALRQFAREAGAEKTGARGLVGAIERSLLPFEARLPSTDIHRLTVTSKTASEPESELERLLARPDDPEWEEDFERLAQAERDELVAGIMDRSDLLQLQFSLALNPTRAGLLADFITGQFLDLPAAASQLDRIYEAVENVRMEFYDRYGIRVEFTEAGADQMVAAILRDNGGPDDVTERFLRDFDYGLNLIKEKTGRNHFTIDRVAVLDPEAYLNDLITELLSTEE